MDKILIASPLPLTPVKSGMQNTIFLLKKFFENKFKIKFVYLDNKNNIDPIFNLKFQRYFSKKLDKLVKSFNPHIIFVNTSKLLFTYKKNFFYEKRKVILVCHDLYYFRKKFFQKIKKKDTSAISKKNEIDVINKCDFIIDFTKEEKKFLLKNKISSKKLIYTNTPIKMNKFTYAKKRKFDLLFVGSNWLQNKISILWFLKKFKKQLYDKKIIVAGTKINTYRNKNNLKNYKNLDKNSFKHAAIGIAPIREGTGRNVKIIEMIGNGLPVLTNKNLSFLGLKNRFHYILVKNSSNWINNIDKLSSNYNFRKFIAYKAWIWSKKNSFYKKAFLPLLKKID